MKLGSGSYGNVSTHGPHAVKKTQMFYGDWIEPGNVTEASLAAHLRDKPQPNLVQVHSIDVDSEGTLHTIMETGRCTLTEYLNTLSKETRWKHTEVLILQIREGLRHLHAMGFVHGDLKPCNIICMFGDDGQDTLPQLKIIDFGFSRAYLGRDVEKVYAGVFRYAAPESMSSKRSLETPTPAWDT